MGDSVPLWGQGPRLLGFLVLPFEKHCLNRAQQVKRAELTFAYSTDFSLT